MSDIENGQHWLDRNRPPRVQITYDVEIGDAIEKKELPLVVGILAHLDRVPGRIADKSFENIDRDNFNEMLSKLAPTITVRLAPAEGQSEGPTAELSFKSMQDFHPLGLVENPALAGAGRLVELYKERRKLRDMLARLDSNVKIGREFGEVVSGDAAAAADDPVKLDLEELSAKAAKAAEEATKLAGLVEAAQETSGALALAQKALDDAEDARELALKAAKEALASTVDVADGIKKAAGDALRASATPKKS